MSKRVPEDIAILLKKVVDSFDREDDASREAQIRKWRQLKLLWDNFSQIWFDSVAHDWRIWDSEQAENDDDYYDRPINVFKAYLESIIAALSVTVPPLKCFPEDADNSLDMSTAKASDKICELIYRNIDAPLVWLHALFVYGTEGMMAAYTYPKADKKYGTYEDKENEEIEEMQYVCPECNTPIDEEILTAPPIPEPGMEGMQGMENEIEYTDNEIQCPECGAPIDPMMEKTPFTTTRSVGSTIKPKTRVCVEIYGGLFVKIPNYAMKQEDCPYLFFDYETHYTNVLHQYPWLRDKLKGGTAPRDEYAALGRLSNQYKGEYPKDNVTVRNAWLRPSSYNVLTDEELKKIKKKYPDGAKVVIVNDDVCEACNEDMDSCWTLSKQPLSDYLHHEPLGMALVAIQDITNDIISLVLQTMEHGIPQTFATPDILNFQQYKQLRAVPGSIVPTKPGAGKDIARGFHEVKTATLSPEVMPFADKIQQLGQLSSGALPSLFGGALEDNKTASGYSMSRAQALQRLQTSWKLLTLFWKEIFAKAIPIYIKNIVEDERDVEIDTNGNFVNVVIRKAETEGKLGRIELEANENLPMTWSQQKDLIMELMQINNPEILQALSSPENIEWIAQAVGLVQFKMPGEADRQKQLDEIRILIVTTPLPMDMDPITGAPMMDPATGSPMEVPSVEIDPDVDNHAVEAEICRGWLISEAGRLAKTENPLGYKNVLLHMKQHQMILQQEMMEQQMAEAALQGQGAPGKKPKEDTKTPKTGEADVNVAN